MHAHPLAIARLTTVLAMLAASSAAFAQPGGTLAGSLFDHTGGALVNVAVDVRGPVVRERHSDAAGRFEFRELPPGDYELNAALAGFASIHRALRIASGTTTALSLTMTVASLEQTVVTAAKTGATDVQSSPLAVSAIPSTDLSRFAIRTIDAAAAQTPLPISISNGSTRAHRPVLRVYSQERLHDSLVPVFGLNLPSTRRHPGQAPSGRPFGAPHR